MITELQGMSGYEWEWILPLGLALLGACVGSFLNVVVYRVPRGMSLCNPRRSFCPSCGVPIPWYLNIPVVSWLVLRGKSACCGKPISVRYVLLEGASAGLFFLASIEFGYEELWVQLAICLWLAGLLCILAMDWDSMVVHTGWIVATIICGLAAVAGDPTLLVGEGRETWEGLLWSCGGIAFGFLLFAFIAFWGRFLYGRRKLRFRSPQAWTLRQEGEDIALTVGERRFLWTEIFMGKKESILLEGAKAEQLQGGTGDVCLLADQLLAPDGTAHSLEAYEQLSGTCTGIRVRREVMGTGDAWIAMAIGSLCGWQGVLFSLVFGSLIGIVFALVQRIGCGKPTPFGPALITAAYLWFFYNPQIQEWLAAYLGLR